MFINRLIEGEPGKETIIKREHSIASPRKVRSDKIHDMRFPVTLDERMNFRRDGKQINMKETQYCTHLLLKALQQNAETIPAYAYKDTGRYMHVKPTEQWYRVISDLAIQYDISERQMVHRLIHFSLSLNF